MAILDFLRAKRKESAQNAWTAYREILGRELAGKVRKSDEAELLQVVERLGLTEEQVAEDLNALREHAELTRQLAGEGAAEEAVREAVAESTAADEEEKRIKLAAEEKTQDAHGKQTTAANAWQQIRQCRPRLEWIENNRPELFGRTKADVS